MHRGLEQTMGVGAGGGVRFVYFDPNDVSVWKFAYVRTKL